MVSNATYLLGMRQPEKVLCEEKIDRRTDEWRNPRQEKRMVAVSARRIANVELLSKRQQLHISPTSRATGRQVAVVVTTGRLATMLPQPSFFSEG